MRKRIVQQVQKDTAIPERDWSNVEGLAEVGITSEDADHPIESALVPGHVAGWRAAGAGKQTIRLIFTQPQPLRQIWLRFSETLTERTQEFVLRWSPDGGQSFREIVRQQWNFSPQGSTSQTEDFQLELPSVTVLELSSIPDISGGNAFASLAQMRLAWRGKKQVDGSILNFPARLLRCDSDELALALL